MDKKRITTLFPVVLADMMADPAIIWNRDHYLNPTIAPDPHRVRTDGRSAARLVQSVFSLSLILGPVLGGRLFEAATPQTVFAVSAGLMVLMLVLSIGMQRLPALMTSENVQGEPVPMHH